MDEEMEEAFEESLEIDFEYEFDVAKYFDFTRPETPEEIEESERWFHGAEGYPPSPLVFRLNWGTHALGDSETSAVEYGHQNAYSISNDSEAGAVSEVSSLDQGKKGHQMLKSKSNIPCQSFLPRSSRLLKPTASHLAKQNRHLGVRSTRVLGRLQKLGSPKIESPGEAVATKRQKLEIGYLRKVAHLKHQTSFSHKLPKKVGATDHHSFHGRPKVTIPKEPDLETARRAQIRRLKNASRPGSNSKSKSSSFRPCPLNRRNMDSTSFVQAKKKSTSEEANVQGGNSAPQSGMLEHKRANSNDAAQQEKSDPVYRFKARPFNKKIFSSKEAIGVFQNCKREITVPREFKLSNKHSQNPPIELFSELSLNSQKQPSSLTEQKPLSEIKGLKKNIPCSIMKENKIGNAVIGKSIKC